jgi:hypothetical protein
MPWLILLAPMQIPSLDALHDSLNAQGVSDVIRITYLRRKTRALLNHPRTLLRSGAEEMTD